MNRVLGSSLVTALVAALLLVAPTPAHADPPSNDAIATPIPFRAPPRTYTVDTSEATATPADGECVAGASVWFVMRPRITRTVRLSTLGSDYDTILAVYRGTRSNRQQIACVDDSFDSSTASARAVRMAAGSTYWVAVSACCDRQAEGGNLVLRTTLPQAPELTATIDSVETGAVSGRLLVHGTAECATPSEFFAEISASQRVGGANVARGGGFVSALCGTGGDGTWTARVDTDTGWAFQAGTVSLTAAFYSFDGFRADWTEPETSNHVVTEDPAARKKVRDR